MLRSVASGACQEIGCRLEDLSLTGLRIHLRGHEDLAPGEQVYLTLTIKEGIEKEVGEDNEENSPVTISLKADVIWCREKESGLRITSINENDLSLYENLISVLKS